MTAFRWWGGRDPRGRTRDPLVAYTPLVDADPWVMHLYQPIDSWGEDWGTSAVEFAAALRQVPDDAALTIALNSPGGEVFEAVAMATLIRQRAGTTTMRVDGIAASAASYLATVGDQLVMGSPEAYLMIHDPLTITYGNEAEHLAAAAVLGSFGDTMAAAYAAKAGGTAEDWRTVMRAERWYSASEAVEAGLADSAAEAAPEDAPPVAARFDLSMYGQSPARPARYRQVAAAVPPVTPPATPDPVPPVLDNPFDQSAFAGGLLAALKGA